MTPVGQSNEQDACESDQDIDLPAIPTHTIVTGCVVAILAKVDKEPAESILQKTEAFKR